MTLTLGSACSGYGGLDRAVEQALGARTAWVAETDPAASRVLAAHWPDAPNHGDVHLVPDVAEHVDITAAGYPCQGESNAGRRLGDEDPRWLWPAYRRIIAAVRPRLAIGENVDAHLGRSFRHVVADLLGDGYAVAWGLVAASDVGACHRRRRLIWAAWPDAYGPPVGLGLHPFAVLEGDTMVVEDLFGGRATAGADWPHAGVAYGGAVYAVAPYRAAPAGELRLPTPHAALGDPQRGAPTPAVAAARLDSGRRNLDDAVAMLPTPTGRDHKGHNQRGDTSCLTGALLPTPAAGSFNDGEDVEQWQARQARQAARGINGNGMGTPLTIAVQLLPTTTATDARGGETRLTHQGGNPTLLGAVRSLLPTPTASDANASTIRYAHGTGGPDLRSVVHLMLTPKSSDGAKGGPNQRGSAGDLTLPSAVQPQRFGPYTAAVARWEALTRPAPDPTVPGRGGKPRLNPAFAEWMMGAPAGWITDVPGVTRSDALRIAGNGVVEQQGAAAITWLLERAPAALRAALNLTPDAAGSAAPALKEAAS